MSVNVCGPFEIVCQCETQVLQFCCCCENFIVQLVKMVAALFSNMHDLAFFHIETHSPTLSPEVKCVQILLDKQLVLF